MSNQVNSSFHLKLDSEPLAWIAKITFVPVALPNLQQFNRTVFEAKFFCLQAAPEVLIACMLNKYTYINIHIK